MAIDPSIALGYKGFEAPNPLAQYAQVAQIQNAQNQNALSQFQLKTAQRGEQDTEALRNALAGVKYGTPEYDQALTGTLLKTGNIKGLQEYQKGQRENDKAAAELAIKQQELKRNIFGNLAMNPSDENIKAHLQDLLIQKQIPQQEADGWLAKTAAMSPAQRTSLFNSLAQTADQRTGHEVTMRGQNMTDARARENIDIARQRLEKDHAMLDPAEQAAISKAIIDGRLDPYKVNGRNAKMMAQTLIAKPDINIKDLGIEAAGAGAAEKAIAGQSAKMSTAANEAGQMIGVVRNLSSQIDRSQYPSLNAIQNAADKGTGGKEIVQLNTSINALVNSYARAISPTGQPTVSDKNHAREILNASYSNGQLGAILDTMGQEMNIAKSAAGEARAQLKAERNGKATPAAATNIDALLDKYKD
jgi:hypothetical protein